MFHTVFDDAAEKVARQISNGAALKVFLVLPRHLSYTQFRRLDQRQLGASIGITDGAVSRALSKLHELGAIERQGKGPVTEWKLSPDYGWKGDVDSYHAEQRRRGQQAPPHKPPARPSVVAECILSTPAPTSAQRENKRQTRLRLLSRLDLNTVEPQHKAKE